MQRKSIYIAVLLVICSVTLCACGAKKPIVSFSSAVNEEISAINSEENIGLILGEYVLYDSYIQVGTEKKRGDLEAKLELCLKKSAGQRRPPIKVLPNNTIKKHLTQNYGFTDFVNVTSSELISTLQAPEASWDMSKVGLRYLVTIDINTNKSSQMEFEVNGEKDFALIGLANDGAKTTSVNLNVFDVKRKLVVEEINISSSGKQGWAAGMALLYSSNPPLVLPIPYFVPWLSFTESKVCTTFGEQIVELITPQIEVEQTISQFKKGDVVLLELKNGDNKKTTITHVDDRFVVGTYEYQLGHMTGVSYERDRIKSVKFLNGPVIAPTEKTELIEMSHIVPGDTVTITFKSGDIKDVTITNIDERFIVGYVYYSAGQSAGVSYDRRDIKLIEHSK